MLTHSRSGTVGHSPTKNHSHSTLHVAGAVILRSKRRAEVKCRRRPLLARRRPQNCRDRRQDQSRHRRRPRAEGPAPGQPTHRRPPEERGPPDAMAVTHGKDTSSWVSTLHTEQLKRLPAGGGRPSTAGDADAGTAESCGAGAVEEKPMPRRDDDETADIGRALVGRDMSLQGATVRLCCVSIWCSVERSRSRDE